MMNTDSLIAELNRLGLHFIVGGGIISNPQAIPPAHLLAGLAEHADARLRLAMVALLLYKPEYSEYAIQSLDYLDEQDKVSFKLYYTAAVLLQQIHSSALRLYVSEWRNLPDLFSKDLNLPASGSRTQRLLELSEIHKAKSGLSVDWLGTYNHGPKRLLSRLGKEAVWAA